MSGSYIGWFGIVRLGLVQTALGAIIVLTTSTLNRIMVVELALPAMLPGFLVAIHHIVQLARPHIGHHSDQGGYRTPWIIGGMLVLALGGVTAAYGTILMTSSILLGSMTSALGFAAIGFGSGATGTSLLVLLAKRVRSDRKPAAATLVWFMMIFGFAFTAGVAGHFLDPYSSERLLMVTTTVSIIALCITLLAIRGVEPKDASAFASSGKMLSPAQTHSSKTSFTVALKTVWQEQNTRRFTVFVFLSMLAYSFQDLILEPFAGAIFGMSPGESTQLAGWQHSGVLIGMLAVAASGSLYRHQTHMVLKVWIIGGCLLSAIALFGIALAAHHPTNWHLPLNVFLLGSFNGAFAVAAIAMMMTLASAGGTGQEGLRMGLWGAAQAIAFAAGGFLGTVAVDLARALLSSPAQAYTTVFAFEAILFVIAAYLSLPLKATPSNTADTKLTERAPLTFGDIAAREIFDGASR
jgi:BCD family chlorophyll transporter-like MFS transporter